MELQLKRLRAQILGLYCLFAVASLLAVSGWSGTQQPGLIKATDIQIVGPDGKDRMFLAGNKDGGSLTILNDRGETTILMGGASDLTHISLFEAKNPRAYMFIENGAKAGVRCTSMAGKDAASMEAVLQGKIVLKGAASELTMTSTGIEK